MDIVIISEFCEDFSKADNDRFLYLAKLLMDESMDNNVEIVTSSFRHTTKKHRRETAEKWPFKITFIEEPGYPRNICFKRFQSHYVWGKNLLNYIKKRTAIPDVIYCAVPSLTGPYLMARYCEKANVRFVIDIQDLWPEAFKMALNIPIISSIVFKPFTILVNGIYRRADSICAVSDTYCKRAQKVNKKVQNTTPVFLGTEIDKFDCYAEKKPILEKKDGEIWLAYCGTLGSSYDLKCVIDALAILDNEKIRFIVMGDGLKAEEFMAYAKEKNISAEFVGRISYDLMCSLLSVCDITVNSITHMSAASIINKHADYAASGKPVINNQESIEYRDLVEKYEMGYNCRNNDCNDFADKLKILICDEGKRLRMGMNARRCAEEMFDRKTTYKHLVFEILKR